MAFVPRTSEQVRMNATSPVPIAGTSDARIQGEAIAQFGSGLEKFGQQQLESQRTIKRANAQSRIQDVVNQAKAETEMEAAADGSDYAQMFKSKSEEKISQVVDEEAGWDPRLRREIGAYSDRVRGDIETTGQINALGRLRNSNIESLTKLGQRSMDRIRAGSESVEGSRNMFLSEYQTFGNTMNEVEAQGGIDKVAAARLRDQFNEGSALQHVNRLAEMKAFPEALEFLQANQEDPTMFTEIDPTEAARVGLISQEQAASLEAKGEDYKIPVMRGKSEIDAQGNKVTRPARQLTPEETQIVNGLNPVKKAQLIEEIKRMAKTETKIDLDRIANETSATVELLLKGATVSPEQVQNTIELNLNGLRSGKMTPYAVRKNINDINTGMVVNNTLGEVAKVPRSERKNLLANAQAQMEKAAIETSEAIPELGDTKNDAQLKLARQRAFEGLDDKLNKMFDFRDKDPVGFYLGHFDEEYSDFRDRWTDPQATNLYKGSKSEDAAGYAATKEFSKYILSKQKAMGIPNPKILSKRDAGELAAKINMDKPDRADEAAWKQGEARYGSFWQQAVNESAGKNTVASDFRLMFHLEDGTQRTRFFNALRNYPKANEMVKGDKALEAKVDAAYEYGKSYLSPYAQSINNTAGDASSVGNINTYHDMLKKAITVAVAENDSASQDPKKLGQTMVNELVANHFDVATEGPTAVMIPKSTGPESQISRADLKVYLQNFREPEVLKELGIAVDPKQFKTSPGTAQERVMESIGMPQATADRLRAPKTDEERLAVIAKKHRWTNTDNNTGIKMEMYNEITGKWYTVTRKNGQPVKYSFKDLNRANGSKSGVSEKVYKKFEETKGSTMYKIKDFFGAND